MPTWHLTTFSFFFNLTIYAGTVMTIGHVAQWRSQDSKLGYSYLHVNKKNQLFLTAMSENTTKYEPI